MCTYCPLHSLKHTLCPYPPIAESKCHQIKSLFLSTKASIQNLPQILLRLHPCVSLQHAEVTCVQSGISALSGVLDDNATNFELTECV